MKKIKSFFLCNYQRLIRFFILFSAVACIVFSSLIANAETPVYFKYARPPVTDNSGYIEVAFDGSYYVFVVLGSYGFASTNNIGSNAIKATYNQNLHTLTIGYSAVDVSTGSFARVYGYWVRSDGKIWGVQPADNGQITITVASSGSPEILRFYGIQPTTSECEFGVSDKVYVYGEDTTLNSNIDFCCNLLSQIKTSNDSQNEKIQAILDKLVFTNEQLIASHEMYVNIWNSAYSIDKKLDTIIELLQVATSNNYSATTPSQKQNQADLDSAEASINADTAEARTSTINIFKNFTLPGDIMKGMLSVTKIFNAMCNCIPFAPIILNFSLAVGAAAFLLGLSAWTIGKFGGRNK